MSRAEKLKLIKEKYPNYKEILSQDEINDLINELDEPEKLQMFRQTGFTEELGGAAIGGPLKSIGKLLFGTKKRAAITGTLGFVGVGIGDLMGSQEGGAPATDQQLTQEQALQAQQDAALQQTLFTAQQAGVDISGLLNTPAAQQAFGANPTFNINAFLDGSQTFGTAGVFVGAGKGKEVPRAGETYNEMRQRLIGKPETASGTISLNDWKKRFPISDPEKLAEWKNKLVQAGVVSASAGLEELKKQWENWGQLSMDSVRMGNNLTPDQLLAIQRGLWGGGGDTGPTYNTQLMKKANSRELLKKFMEVDTGRIISDEEADDFADLIRKRQLAKPTKTETKVIKGKKVSVTTPGFGEAEAVKIAEQRAMQDPMYKEFQTANVFGTALEKALGVRG